MANKSKDGSKNRTDEKFNYLSHLFGAIVSVYAAVFLIIQSSSAWEYVAYSIYGASLVFLFLASSFHHGFNGKRKTNLVLLKIDYAGVFILIAGTFTPICLIYLRNKIGWSILGIVWILAIIGITLKSTIKKFPKAITNLLTLCMGWGAVFLISPIFELSKLSFWLFVIGGLSYTIGAIIFAIEKPNLIKGKFGFHEIWHIFVLIGAFTHIASIYFLI